ncbi:MAG: LamG domain-containing protein, partial [Acidimicrobiia bacterium]|nr:LamG domain-containing protein [Acidimicrobiia bacterium]
MKLTGPYWRGALAVALVAALLVVQPPHSPAQAAGTDYRDTVLADNPVAYWRFGEASGSAAVDTAGSLDGIYENAPSLSQPGLVIDSDSAVRFGGATDLVHIPDSPLINQGTRTQRTIEVWFQVDDASDRQVIVEEGGGSRGLNIYVEGGQLFFGGWNLADDLTADTPWGGTFFSAAVSSGVTHHAVLVLDQLSATLTGYLDGAEAGAGAAGTLHGHGADTGIGAMNNSSRFPDGSAGGDGHYFVGVIDEVAFYNSVLSPSDVADHYAAGIAPAVEPAVEFVAPNDGAIVSGTVNVEVAASDPQDAAGALTVDISTDAGATFAPAAFNPGADTHSINWDTTLDADGPSTLVARVLDTDGNTTTANIAVSVSNNPGSDEYADMVLADGPVVYYRLGEVGGTTASDELDAVDSSYIGGPALGQTGLVIGADTSVDFDGINDFVAVPDSNLINKGQFAQRSVEAWFNVRSSAARQVIYEEGAGTRGLSIYVEAGQLYAGAWNLSGQVWGPIFLNTPVSAAATHHVVAVLDTGSFELFLDGVSVAVDGGAGMLFNHTGDTGIAAMNDAARFHDGKLSGNGLYFDGTIDEVAIYNTPLSTATISAHHTAGLLAAPQLPSVTFIAPTASDTVSGTVPVEVTASDPQDSPSD